MKKILILFILIHISTLLFAEVGFRNVNWGDSMDQVRQAEKSVLNIVHRPNMIPRYSKLDRLTYQ